MTSTHTDVLPIYKIRPSFEEDRATIDFTRPENGAHNHDFEQLEAVFEGNLPVQAAPPMAYSVEDADALEFHYYSNPGTPGMLSERAAALLRPFCEGRFEFAPVTINGAPFFMPICISHVDCLNRELSILVPFPHDPNRVMNIKKYGFHKDRLQDPMMFCIPESRMAMFVTESVKQAIDASGLRGIYTEFVGNAV